MKTADILELQVVIHWWNFGKKTLDFKGTLKECLESKEIRYKKDEKAYIFTYSLGNSKITYKTTGGFVQAAKDILCFQLIQLGDKAQLGIQNHGIRTINF